MTSESVVNQPKPRHNIEVRLTIEQCDWIMDALLIGLSSFAEVDRVHDQLRARREFENIPEDFIPLHPTGADDTTGKFATALSTLYTTMSVAEAEA